MNANKFLVAVICGLVTVCFQLVRKRYGLDLGPYEAEVINGIGAAVTAAFVYLVPNKPKAEQP